MSNLIKDNLKLIKILKNIIMKMKMKLNYSSNKMKKVNQLNEFRIQKIILVIRCQIINLIRKQIKINPKIFSKVILKTVDNIIK